MWLEVSLRTPESGHRQSVTCLQKGNDWPSTSPDGQTVIAPSNRPIDRVYKWTQTTTATFVPLHNCHWGVVLLVMLNVVVVHLRKKIESMLEDKDCTKGGEMSKLNWIEASSPSPSSSSLLSSLIDWLTACGERWSLIVTNKTWHCLWSFYSICRPVTPRASVTFCTLSYVINCLVLGLTVR